MPMHKRGFTLVEILIYVAILAIVSSFAVNGIILSLKTFNGYRVLKHINVSASFAMEKMSREIRRANTISPNSVLGSHPGHLILGDTEFFASGSSLMIKTGTGAPTPLIADELELINLVFREVATSTLSHSRAIKIEMTVRGSKGSYQKTENFYNSVVLRGNYQQ